MFCGRCGNRAYRYSPSEVAEALQVSVGAVYKWIHSGQLNASQPEPGTYRVRSSAVARMLTANPGLQVRTWWRWHLKERDEAMRAHHGLHEQA